MKYERSQWALSHTMPAFVGSAQQSCDWRIPSVKGALRYWWRLVVSAQNPQWKDHKALLALEGSLFGQVLADDRANKSQIRLCFDGRSRPLSSKPWPAQDFGYVGEGRERAPGDIYLGYGAIQKQRGAKSPTPVKSRWIEPNTNGTVLLQSPPAAVPEIKLALAALHHLGGLGNRCRRGWGSAVVLDRAGREPLPLQQLIDTCGIGLDTALQREWANGIVTDSEGALIWQTQHHIQNWQDCVKELAPLLKVVNKDMRQTEQAGPKGSLATMGGVKPRWPSLLRLKVVNGEQGLRIRVIFLPFKMPATTRLKLDHGLCHDLIDFLDQKKSLNRFNAEQH